MAQLALDPGVLVPCAANIDSRFSSRALPQSGHFGLAEELRTSISQSWPHFLHVNS